MSYTSKTVEKRGDTRNSSARLVFVALAILVQIFWIMYLFITLNDNYKWISGLVKILSIVVVIVIYNSDRVANIKLPWIILILVFPLMGLVFYIMVKYSGTTKNMKKRLQLSIDKCSIYLPRDRSIEAELKKEEKDIYNISDYISRYSN